MTSCRDPLSSASAASTSCRDPLSSASAASTSCRDPLSSASAPSSVPPTVYLAPSTVCLVPCRWRARLLQEDQQRQEREEEEEAAAAVGGVHFAATATALRRFYGLKLLHSVVHPYIMLRLDREECRAAVGTGYALATADQLSQALAGHDSDSNLYAGVSGGYYPLVLWLCAVETNILLVKISKEDNAVESFKRANRMFNLDFQRVHFWDFSGQTSLMLKNKRNKPCYDCCLANQEIRLEVQVYEVSDSTSKSGWISKERCAGSTNGSFQTARSMGLVGLDNLGNTCFMNCSIQCLVHTPKLATYFLGDYGKDLFLPNGELALAFGRLLRCLWTTDRKSVSPKYFKEKFASFDSRFLGSNQQDSQEFLDSLLVGLHTDLNQIKHKPHIVKVPSSNRAEDIKADENWRNHLAENDSVIIDIFHGQCKSTLICRTCNEKSDTFEPIAYLSLPVPFTPNEDSVALHDCLEAFLKEEPLGPQDMWYCPRCQRNREALKKFDLWRLPEVLVIHLKRFSHTQFSRNKIETSVDFPINDLDLSARVCSQAVAIAYMLLATIMEIWNWVITPPASITRKRKDGTSLTIPA